jgi:RNA polymerase sigma-70 factor (ECF subfamily)
VEEANELAQALRRREESAIAELYDRYGVAVYNLALRITRDPGLAEETSLDTFLQAWQQVERYDGRQGSLASWLFTIARSRSIDRLRARTASKRTQTDDPMTPPAAQPEEIAELAQRRQLVRAAMAGLPAAQRQALELAYDEGLSHSQIAARLGEPLGTVKTRIRQAMLVLRKQLAPVLSSTTS